MENKRNIKKYIFIGATIFVVILAIVISLIIIISKKEKINLNSYLEITYSGFDGYGKAEYEINYSSIVEDYAKELGLETEKEIYFLEYDLNECIDGKLSKKDELKNEDEIIFKWDVDVNRLENKYDIEISFEDVYEKVCELEEVVEFDPFEYVNIEFTGMSKDGKVKIISKNEEYSWIEYKISKDNFLSNGDKITVEVENNDRIQQNCLENGIKFSRMQSEYTVEGLGYYFSSIKDIPATEMSKMKKHAEDIFKVDVETNWGEEESLKGMTYLGCYLLNDKEDDIWIMSNNCIYLVYRIDVSNSWGEFSYYYYTKFEDAYVTGEGEYILDLENYEVPYGSAYKYGGQWYLAGAAFAEGDFWYEGYRTLEEIFDACVNSNAGMYTYETNIE